MLLTVCPSLHLSGNQDYYSKHIHLLGVHVLLLHRNEDGSICLLSSVILKMLRLLLDVLVSVEVCKSCVGRKV